MPPETGLPQGLSPEAFRAMLEAAVADQRAALAGQDYKRGAADSGTMQPDGKNLGYTYVAANPMEHLASAIQRVQGGMRMDRSQAQQQDIIGQRQGGMEALIRAMQLGGMQQGQAQREAQDPFADVRNEGY
jgi:hypothetical protein